jgi:hypothetical protein
MMHRTSFLVADDGRFISLPQRRRERRRDDATTEQEIQDLTSSRPTWTARGSEQGDAGVSVLAVCDADARFIGILPAVDLIRDEHLEDLITWLVFWRPKPRRRL